jgi:Zn-finger nucleic acid-binding protein
MQMKCPNCQAELYEKSYKGIDVDFCDNCRGMWLDADELDELEDKAFDEDDLKGSLMVSSSTGNRHCPHCDSRLKKFQYRLYSLELEYCDNDHGYWLDAGEEKRVLELMKQREQDMERKFDAESEWQKMLKKLRKKSIFK